MSDFVWVLRHPTNKVTKTWLADGTIENYADPKLFIGVSKSVSNIRDLSDVLFDLEGDPHACVIRGKYKGFEHSRIAEPADSKKGRVLRRKSVHDDISHHWLLVDIDNYEPFDYDPLLEPIESVDEFIRCCLPACFHGVSHHIQLSSSAGHPSKDPSKLKAHVWFWLKKPYLSVQLREWAKVTGFKGDKALFDTIQVHYTAAPCFEEGVVNPLRTRSWFVEGEFGDEVTLQIDQELLDRSGDGAAPASRYQKLQETWSSDPIVSLLYEKGMVKSQRADGALNIVCPRESEHTGESGESATIYFPAHTGGHKNHAFKCMHDHCRGVPTSRFLDALGYDDAEDVFVSLDDEIDIRREIPHHKHLCTDQANANRIVENFRDRMIAVADSWFAWDGKRWKRDEGGVIIKAMNLSKLVHKEADKFIEKAAKVKSKDERAQFEKLAESLNKWGQKCEMAGTISAALTLVKKVLSIDSAMLDRNEFLLNVRNGVVDLRTKKLKPHDPDDFITHYVDIDYDPDAICPNFEEVLRRVMMEEDRGASPITDFAKRWFGYCLTGSTREQKFVVHYGNGRNGKSTILDTIANVMGSYAGVAAPSLMLSSGKDRHPTEIADLLGRRMVTAHESGEGGVLREDFIKQSTGGDKLKGRYMGRDFFEFSPTHKLQLLTNYKPIIKGQDEGIWRRVLLLPYVARFGTEEEVTAGVANYVRDTGIIELLAKEYQGILTWLIAGAAEWFRDGLQPPDAVIAASKDYQVEQDRAQQFINEVCTIGPDQECYLTNGTVSGIYVTYRKWCELSGIHPLSKVNFLNNLERVVPYFKKYEKKIEENGRRRKVLCIKGISSVETFEL